MAVAATSKRGPRHQAPCPPHLHRRRDARKCRAQGRGDAGAAANCCWRRSSSLSRPCPRSTRARRAAERRRGAVRETPATAQRWRRSSAARERGERAPQEALHQPLDARRGLPVYVDALRPAHRVAAAPRTSRVAGRKLYCELTMLVPVNSTAACSAPRSFDLGQPRARPPGPGHRAQHRSFGHFTTRCAPGRPDRAALALPFTRDETLETQLSARQP